MNFWHNCAEMGGEILSSGSSSSTWCTGRRPVRTLILHNLIVCVSGMWLGGCKSFTDGFFRPLPSTLTSSNPEDLHEEQHFPCSVLPGIFKVNIQLIYHSIFIKICENGNFTSNKPYLECGCLRDQQGPAHV